MRAPLIALLCGLAAVATLLILREGGERRDARIAAPAPAPAPASAAVAAAPLQPPLQARAPVPSAPPPVAASAARPVAVALAKPPAPEAPPRRSVFALSSDHQTLLHDTPLASADRDLLERESRDDAWATESERLIRQEIARQDNAADFDVIAVDCRQTLCAIEAFSYGEDGHREWVEAMDEAFKEALGSAFTSINTAFPTEGSRAPVLTFLHRRPVETKP
jgi:hypothetical protein